ncbi:ribulose-phosphate 3-epimerase, partial [Cutibacterium acnes subsp. acnes]|nr:ribulose-phosphate 3-epimerase [Cutibacterium acnes subsp. acnes]
ADTFVAGSAVYRSDNPDHVVASLRNRALAAQVCAH